MSHPYLSSRQALLQSWRLQLAHRIHFVWFLLATLACSLVGNYWIESTHRAQRQAVDQVLENFQNQQQTVHPGTQAPSDLFAQKGRFVLTDVPEGLQQTLAPWGVRQAQGQEPTHFELKWIAPTGKEASGHLELTTLNSQADANGAMQLVASALERDERRRLVELAKANEGFEWAPSVRLSVDDVALRQQVAQALPSVMRLMLAGLLVVGITFLAGSTLGIEWDLQRAASNLESWALSYHPLWVLYGSQALARATGAAAFCVVLLVPTLLFMRLNLLETAISTIVVTSVAFSLTLFLCMWSLLSTMLFRHRYGRMFGRLALSPFSLGAVFLFRVTLLLTLLRGVSSFVTEGSSAFGWTWMALAGLALSGVCLFGAVALVPIIEARIGERRIGLRKL